MAELRERKSASATSPHVQHEEDDHSEAKLPKRGSHGPEQETNIFVLAAMFVAFTLVVGTFFWYTVDNREHGAFATWVNTQYPALDRALNHRSSPLFGASAQDVPAGDLRLTEEELKPFDGTDPDKPIYLAIDGKIFDVSASPAFYGPGGHYNHFVGKDATRAWITECWDEQDQFTWRLDDVEVMFQPKWLDEQLEKAGSGDFTEDLGDLSGLKTEMLTTLAKKAMERYGTVTDGEKKRRRETDQQEAEAKVKETLDHWVGFFSKNPKYKVVGSVIRDETRPAPPKPCEEAMKKRPMKGGRLETLMSAMSGKAGNADEGVQAGAGGAGGASKGEMPEFIKQRLAERAAKEAAEKEAEQSIGKEAEIVEEVDLGADDGEEMVHEEL